MKKSWIVLLFLHSFLAKAQVNDTLLLQRASFNAHQNELPSTTVQAKPGYLSLKKIGFPIAMVLYGLVGLGSEGIQNINKNVRDEILEDHENFHTNIDNYLQFVPAASVYVLNVSGVKGKNNFKDRTILFAMSTLIMAGTVSLLKNTTHQMRPDSSANNSFPSGHTATAFSGAEFMAQEYRGYSPWLRFSGYAVGTGTGILRMYNNKHWLSDVLAGAGIGIISTKVSYWLYEKIKKKKSNPISSL